MHWEGSDVVNVPEHRPAAQQAERLASRRMLGGTDGIRVQPDQEADSSRGTRTQTAGAAERRFAPRLQAIVLGRVGRTPRGTARVAESPPAALSRSGISAV